MERRTLARGLVFAALVCFGSFLWAGMASAQEANVVQGQNGSAESEAFSDFAVAENEMFFQAGPSADSDGAPAMAAQNGDNVGSHSQSANAKSGDAAAGSQVNGVVGSGATIQAQQSTVGAIAVSGPAEAFNDTGLGIFLGPQAGSFDGTAQASQIGDNRLDAFQTAIAHSGDAVAGSQVTGVVGVGDHTVQIQNTSEDPEAFTGFAEAFNSGEISLGPAAFTDFGDAQASQVGDNDAVFSQSSEAVTGDAVAGSQVTGVVGSGKSTTQGQSSSLFPLAESGDVFASNFAAAVFIGPSAVSGFDPAQSSQVGDNTVEIGQAIEAESGDAVAGSQVTGLVGFQAGHLEVQNQQSSDGDTAFSGFVDAENEIFDVIVGPFAEGVDFSAMATQNGSNDVSLWQDAALASGDAVAGGQITGIVGGGDVTVQNQNTSIDGFSESGDVGIGTLVNLVEFLTVGPWAFADFDDASAAQVGDNSLAASQEAHLQSGDALAGAQVTGVVSGRADVTIQNQNSSDADEAFSGEVSPFDVNVLADGHVGPHAAALFFGATASQVGDNDVAVAQTADLHSGDAVAGSQVTGVVAASGEVTVQQQNSSEFSIAETGFVEPGFANAAMFWGVGPAAISDGDDAMASQVGDNSLVIDQDAIASSGDAVAGAQVTGVVTAGGDVTVQNQNSSIDADALSGDAASFADLNLIEEVNVGPVADAAFIGVAQASQTGDNDALLAQSAHAHSGDAVAGGQVTGVVTRTGDITVQNQNVADAPIAESGDANIDVVVNDIFGVTVGPEAFADFSDASASQVGSNEAAIEQHALAATGDAVAGAQVTGVVAGAGDVTVQAQNDSIDSEAYTGFAFATNVAEDINVGPLALGDGDPASAAQVGDNALGLGQAAIASTGDAVAGAQVIGSVGGANTVQLQNFDDFSLAESSDADADNYATGIVGPFAFGFFESANAQQIGDSSFLADQLADAQTGDAVAGAQVTGLAWPSASTLSTGGALAPMAAGATGEGSFAVASGAAS